MGLEFWIKAFNWNWCTKEQLSQAVYSENNPNGEKELTPQKYKELTGLNWEDPYKV